MLNAIFSSFAMLKDNIIVMIFYYTIFAITGEQVFGGTLKNNCFDITTVNIYIFRAFFKLQAIIKILYALMIQAAILLLILIAVSLHSTHNLIS